MAFKTAPYRQAVQLQRLLVKLIENPETKPRDAASCACAWERLEERKRILKMRPKPRDLSMDELARLKRLTKPVDDCLYYERPMTRKALVVETKVAEAREAKAEAEAAQEGG